MSDSEHFSVKLLRFVVHAACNAQAKTIEPKTTVGSFDRPKKTGNVYCVGFGKESILPPDLDRKKYYIAGYNENNPAKGVLDSPYVHALLADDKTGRGPVLFLSFDAVGLLNRDVNEIRKRLKDFCYITHCRAVNVFCTHDHAGIDTMGIWGKLPHTGRDPQYMELIFSAARKAAFRAFYGRKDGAIFWGETEVEDLQEDEREPIVYSKTLTRFRFVPSDGTREVWWLNFAAHSESLQGNNPLVSADFPGYLRQKILEKTGAEAFYCVGAVGGMITMKVENVSLLRKEHRLPESTRNIGFRLAHAALSIKKEQRLNAEINFAVSSFFCEPQNPVLMLAAAFGLVKADLYRANTKKNPLLKTEMTYLELGGVPILMLPCELFPELAYGGALPSELSATGKGTEANPPTLCETAGKKLLFIGLANDELGYVMPPNDFLVDSEKPYLKNAIDRRGRRHYEETNSIGPNAAKDISDAFCMLMKEVNKG